MKLDKRASLKMVIALILAAYPSYAQQGDSHTATATPRPSGQAQNRSPEGRSLADPSAPSPVAWLGRDSSDNFVSISLHGNSGSIHISDPEGAPFWTADNLHAVPVSASNQPHGWAAGIAGAALGAAGIQTWAEQYEGYVNEPSGRVNLTVLRTQDYATLTLSAPGMPSQTYHFGPRELVTGRSQASTN